MTHHTHSSISYQLTIQKDKWVIWCVMLLFNAHLLTGHSKRLINSIVRLVQTRKPIETKSITNARRILRRYHTNDLVNLIYLRELML